MLQKGGVFYEAAEKVFVNKKIAQMSYSLKDANIHRKPTYSI